MGVYIKGIDYPKMLSQTITIMRDGRVYSYPSGQKIGEAVEVKKHGRLIDGDALLKDYEEEYGYEEAKRVNDYWIGEAPTVIGAEE